MKLLMTASILMWMTVMLLLCLALYAYYSKGDEARAIFQLMIFFPSFFTAVLIQAMGPK